LTFVFRLKLFSRLMSMSTSLPPQLQLPHTAAPHATPMPNANRGAPGGYGAYIGG
jgi:hypothetical protein